MQYDGREEFLLRNIGRVETTNLPTLQPIQVVKKEEL